VIAILVQLRRLHLLVATLVLLNHLLLVRDDDVDGDRERKAAGKQLPDNSWEGSLGRHLHRDATVEIPVDIKVVLCLIQDRDAPQLLARGERAGVKVVRGSEATLDIGFGLSARLTSPKNSSASMRDGFSPARLQGRLDATEETLKLSDNGEVFLLADLCL